MARVVAYVPDLFFGAKVKETLSSAGHEVELVPTAEATVDAKGDVVIVDLHIEGLDAGALVRGLGGTPTLGFYSHVDEDAKHMGRLAGLDLVVPRSRMAREMPALVDQLLG